jgi:hypothetical protein
VSVRVNYSALPWAGLCDQATVQPFGCDVSDLVSLRISDGVSSDETLVTARFNGLQGLWFGPYTVSETRVGAVSCAVSYTGSFDLDLGNLPLAQTDPLALVFSASNVSGVFPVDASPPRCQDTGSFTTGGGVTIESTIGQNVTGTLSSGSASPAFQATVNGNSMMGSFGPGLEGPGSGTFSLAKEVPEISLSDNSLQFSATANGQNPATQSFIVTNKSTANPACVQLSFTDCSSLLFAAFPTVPWISLSLSTGPTKLGPGQSSTQTVAVNTTGLDPGTYTGTIVVIGDVLTSGPKALHVTLTVSP